MATDIKLDQQGGNWLLLEANAVKVTAADLMLDSAGRRRGGAGLRRALVHDFQDGLTINFNGDYPGGVTVNGNLAVSGNLAVAGTTANSVSPGEVTMLEGQVGALEARLFQLRDTIESLANLIGAVVVPAWNTKLEVEEGDDMGIVFKSAAELGLVVQFEIDQRNPAFGHEDVVSITPPAGTVVLRGSTVVVRINLEG